MTSGSGGLNSPITLIFVPGGDLLVSSVNSSQILRYSATTGAFLGVFASSPNLTPVGMAIGPDGKLYVGTHTSVNAIKRFDLATGAFLGDFATGPELTGPEHFSFGPDGDLYVPNYYTSQILRYNGTTGALRGVFASGPGVSGPTDVQFGPDGGVYVANAAGNSVTRLSPAGQLIGTVVTGLQYPARLLFTDLARNVISGNTGSGVTITGSGTTGNTVAGNFVGTDPTGLAAVPNTRSGVLINLGAAGNTIGGTTAGARQRHQRQHAGGRVRQRLGQLEQHHPGQLRRPECGRHGGAGERRQRRPDR